MHPCANTMNPGAMLGVALAVMPELPTDEIRPQPKPREGNRFGPMSMILGRVQNCHPISLIITCGHGFLSKTSTPFLFGKG